VRGIESVNRYGWIREELISPVELRYQGQLRYTARSSADCASMGVCARLPRSGDRWAVVFKKVLISAMVGIVFVLVLMHRRAQASDRIRLEEYYREQTA
jgi:hypothetical protein